MAILCHFKAVFDTFKANSPFPVPMMEQHPNYLSLELPGSPIVLDEQIRFPGRKQSVDYFKFPQEGRGLRFLRSFDLSLSSVAKMRHCFASGLRSQGRKVLNLIEKKVKGAFLEVFCIHFIGE